MAEFHAGLGFARAGEWAELVGKNTELQRWVKSGFSEYMGPVPMAPVYKPNSHTTTGENESFVRQSVAD